MAALAEA
jgi:hypothetical protein